MLKRALKAAIGPALGVMIGGIIIPRLTRPHLYNETYPSILVQAGISLLAGYIGSILGVLLIWWVKDKLSAPGKN